MTRITFLGTADSIPSAKRNHTSILFSKDSENILIDCGEGTQRQFRKAKLNPCRVTRILISHWHGDHVLGLPGFLSTLAFSGYNKILYIYGPKGTQEKFWQMMDVFSFKRDYEIAYTELSSSVFFENENFSLSCELMEHGIPCLAYSILEKGHLRIKPNVVKELGPGIHIKDLKEGRDVVWNGKKIKSRNSVYKEKDKKISIVMDTKKNVRIVPFVKDSDILISEGTYSDELKKEAEKNMHLTVKQVAEIAKKSKAGKLIIVHVSSRYLDDLSVLEKEARLVFANVFFPRDLDFFDF